MRWINKKENKNNIGRPVVPVSPDEFIVDCREVSSKDVAHYIHGRAVECFGNDYYSGYVYNKSGYLLFFACRSKTHLEGRIPTLAPAFIHEGHFEYREGERTHLLVNDGTVLSCDLVYERTEAAIDLSKMEPGAWDSMPATMKLKWSLRKDLYPTSLITGVLFLLSLAFLSIQAASYDVAYRKAITAEQTATSNKAAQNTASWQALPDISTALERDGKIILTVGGVIKQVRFASGSPGLVYTVSVADEGKAQQLMSLFPGSTYKEGNVVLPGSM